MQKYCINKYNRFNKIILNDMQVCENGCIYNSRERDLAKKKKKKGNIEALILVSVRDGERVVVDVV